jgi:uncharacterized protein (TIGR03437 family)
LSFSGAGTITTGGTVSNPPPTIAAVQDAGSYTSNLAQGSIFVVRGTNLCATGTVYLPYTLPTSSGGTSITFTPVAGGTGTQAYLIDTYNANNFSQITAVLPSTLATGNYNVTVTYNNVPSAAVPVTVVKQKPAMFTQDSSGSGLVNAQNIVSATEYDINRLTTGSLNGYTISPAKPGQTLIIYATGLGPVPGGDNIAQSAYNFLTNGVSITVMVGGTAITPLYAGRAPGFSGFDQINVTLPANITTGCTVPVQIVEGNVTSAATTISIAPSTSASACVLPGYTSTQLAALDNGGTITAGGFSILSYTESIPSLGNTTINTVGGGFTQITGFELGALSGSASFSQNTVGSCNVIQVTVSATGQVTAGGVATNLDAGAVTISGPSGSSLSSTPLVDTNGAYSLQIGAIGGVLLPGAVNGSIVAGTYNLKGAGGTGVGSFSTSITLGSPLTVNGGLPSAVNRAQGLPLTWTGGNSTDVVTILGYSGTTSGTGTSAVTTATEFICTTTAGTGGFTVSPQVLTQLPATAAAAAGGTGILEVVSGPAPVSFSAPLTAGGGSVASSFSASSGTAGTVTYQ